MLGTGCGGLSADPESGAEGDGWRAVAESPLTPRDLAVAVSLGERVLVVGGSEAAPCPPNAECALPDEPALRDGAIYDPADDSWTRIADAPFPLGGPAGHVVSVVIGDVAYFLVASDEPDGSSTLLSYNVGADAWDELPPPPVRGGLVATGDELVVYAPSHEKYGSERIVPTDLPPDVVFDPATATWDELPADPHRPSFDRKMIGTDAGLVLLAKDLVPNPGVDPPIVRAAVLGEPTAAGQWSTLPDGEVLWTGGFRWAGGVLVNPDQSSADGGENNNWGRSYPAGGILDPETGIWSDLPEHPAEAAVPSSVDLPIELYLSGPRTAVYGQWALDVRARAWFAVPQNAVNDNGEPVDLPQTGQASAWVETPSGGAVLLWGGARWPSRDDGAVSVPGEFTSDGFLWTVRTR